MGRHNDLFLTYNIKMAIRHSHGGPGRGQGRKPLAEGVPTVAVSVRITAPQKEKLTRLGGAAWVRRKIDQAKEPDT